MGAASRRVVLHPIDASVLLRLALYMTLGLGSWLGATIVERILDSVLR